MSETKRFHNDPSHPINLDSDQLEALNKLIDNLKKEIILPVRRNGKTAPVPTEGG